MTTKIVGVMRKKCYPTAMLTPEQSRAARGWLDWTQQDLADKASVSLSTVRDFEKGRRSPIQNNLGAMERVFRSSGVRFLFDGQRAAGIAIPDPGADGPTAAESGMLQGSGGDG